MSLNERERITLLMMVGWGNNRRSHEEACHLFNDYFPERQPICRTTVGRTVQRFMETGSVSDRPRSGRPASATNEDISLDVLQSFIENPHESLRSAAETHDISVKSVQNIMKGSNFKAYKVHLVHELNEDDYDRRIEFCETMMAKIDRNEIDVNNIVFSDECTFMLNGGVNRHNCRYWSSENPHWMREAHTQYPLKVNVWLGVIGTQLVGPFFIEGNLNAISYQRLLENEITPALRNMFGEHFQNIWFQQDGAPPHYGIDVRAYVNTVFRLRWIGRRGTVEWPARSPDLSPLDYFVWGYLKDNVYKTKPQNVNELRQRILQECQAIPQVALQNSVNSFYVRLSNCQITGGEQFEHLL